VLAALSRPNQNYCPEALEVLREVSAKYPDDTVLLALSKRISPSVTWSDAAQSPGPPPHPESPAGYLHRSISLNNNTIFL
jgi:hypothetical protein